MDCRNLRTTHMLLRSPNRRHKQPRLGFSRIARHSTINDIIQSSLSLKGRDPIHQRTAWSTAYGRQKTSWLDHDSMTCGSSPGVGCYGDVYPCIILCPGHGGDGGRDCHGEKDVKYSAPLNTSVFVPLEIETLGPSSVTD